MKRLRPWQPLTPVDPWVREKRGVVALRQVFNSDKRLVTFLHEGDQMVVRHAITVSGPNHDVEMNLAVRIGYDEQGKFATIDVEPADLDLFDYVVNSRLNQPAP
jgi:hypothetical protein